MKQNRRRTWDISTTCAEKDDVERASLAFLVGNTALSSEQEATLLLTIEGVWIATKGYTEGLQAQGFAPLSELVQHFAARGGQIWVCGACAKPRNITQEHLVEGAQIIGAATAVEALVKGAQTLSFWMLADTLRFPVGLEAQADWKSLLSLSTG